MNSWPYAETFLFCVAPLVPFCSIPLWADEELETATDAQNRPADQLLDPQAAAVIEAK